VRRTAALLGLVLLGALLVLLVRAPERPLPPGDRGHRVFRVSPQAVRGIDVALGERGFSARRTADGWTIDAKAAGALTAEALDDLVTLLATLRAVDVFRHEDPSHFGLEHPTGTITLSTARGERRLTLGGHNLARTVVYARRDGDPRLLQVGTMLLSSLDRVFYRRDQGEPRKADAR
jgi:hypothetical protein